MAITINLIDKVAIVTGGTRGIGKAIVEKFLIAGARVIATGTSNSQIEKLNKVNKNQLLSFYQLDFSDPKSIKIFIEKVKHFNVDILINNAGINKVSSALSISQVDFQKIQEINVHGPFLLAQELGQNMIEKKYGRIINIASIWSIVTRSGRLSYSTSKMALLGISKTLAIELAKHNVLVNSISPGFTLTELTKSTNTIEELKVIENNIPQKRMALPEEIANTVLFLASDLNSYIVGQNIAVDGGYTSI